MFSDFVFSWLEIDISIEYFFLGVTVLCPLLQVCDVVDRFLKSPEGELLKDLHPVSGNSVLEIERIAICRQQWFASTFTWTPHFSHPRTPMISFASPSWQKIYPDIFCSTLLTLVSSLIADVRFFWCIYRYIFLLEEKVPPFSKQLPKVLKTLK